MVDVKKMMRQAQQMQDKLQTELEEMRVSATVGGGMVTATVNGAKALLELKIERDVVDPDDVEMLQDLVVSAVGEATRRADEQAQQKIGGMIPGGLGALGGMLG
ncbi:MAG TPA: YbaB/EbfC family nucleoid-associated protein [Acidobacteriota bacterium]|nr:YbaB/EbfC family nucleoid-associated protein [Acidobacteriota bacterium]